MSCHPKLPVDVYRDIDFWEFWLLTFTMTDDFFRARIEHMIDLRHPLAVLATRMPWDGIEASLLPLFARRDRLGQRSEHVDLFGPTVAIAGGGVSHAGRPRLPIRLMVSLLYLKHAFNLSDEDLVERWSQDVLWQFFSGRAYFEHSPPCDASQIVRFRQILGEAGVEELLAKTLQAAVEMRVVKPQEFERVIVDTTVQEKAIAHPTDSRLLDVARRLVVRTAQRCGIALKQTFDKEGATLRRKAGGYAHARQFKRLKRVIKRQRTILGKLLREVQRKRQGLQGEAARSLDDLLLRAQRIHTQQPQDKHKLYALHAPEAECISKGKARHPYEFGVKVSVAVTHQHGLMVGARSFAGNPYDGHTLRSQLEQTGILLQDLNVSAPKVVVVDLGYRGHDAPADVQVIHRGRYKSLTRQQKTWLRRRQAVEPAIGHAKSENRLGRCYLKGALGDAMNAVLAACGYNLRWLLRQIARMGIQAAFFRLAIRRWLQRFEGRPTLSTC